MTTRIWPTVGQALAHAPQTARRPLSWDPARHLLSRFAYGPTPDALAYIRAHGVQGWYSDQLHRGRTRPGYTALPQATAVAPLIKLSTAQVYRTLGSKSHAHQGDAMDQLGLATLALQGFSPAQLYETLVDFFSNHLNVTNHSTSVWASRADYDRTVIRAHAMGSFTDMLLASARHPAMMAYLNLAESTKADVNENYGRELLELHTVGLNYTEADVRNTAKALTGRTWSEGFDYTFDPSIHWVGPIRVLGFRAANGSARDGDAVGNALLRYLAGHHDTAHNLARQLCVRFVSDEPSAGLVSAVAQAYLAHHTQILPMIDTILRSEEFWSSRGAKVRRPAENILATVRLLDVGVTNWPTAMVTLKQWATPCGNMPLEAPYPPGYPDVATAWRSSANLLNLWNMQQALVNGYAPGFAKLSSHALYGGSHPSTSGAAVAAVARLLLGDHPGQTTLTTLQRFVGEPASTSMSKSRMRSLQRPLATLALHSPQHALR